MIKIIMNIEGRRFGVISGRPIAVGYCCRLLLWPTDVAYCCSPTAVPYCCTLLLWQLDNYITIIPIHHSCSLQHFTDAVQMYSVAHISIMWLTIELCSSHINTVAHISIL
jgi:hypothetical protein